MASSAKLPCSAISLAAFMKPAQALRAAKLAIDSGTEMDLESGLKLESQLFTELFATEDRREGMAAFVEKPKPNFTGR